MAEDLRLFGITGDWNTAALDHGVKCSTVREGGFRFMTEWVKEEENASEHRQREREAEEADKVEVVPGVTVASEQAYALLQKRSPANRMQEHRNEPAHEEVAVVGSCSAWVTVDYPRGSCRESWKTRGNVGRGARKKNGRTTWQRVFGYLASRGTGTLPHLTLGPSIAQHVKGASGI